MVLHITNIENPLCIECEKSLSGQVEELAALKALDTNVQIVTLNLRKNPYSIDGRELAQTWWEVNITWPWIEDLDPYPIGSKYLDYWTVRGGSSNPTIVLIDKEGRIGPVYHVYRVGEGIEDGVQKALSLLDDIQELNGTALMVEGEASPPAEVEARPEGATSMISSLWTRMENEVSRKDVTAFGMFLLGIFTSLAPCSIALMIAVFSYVMTVRRKDEYLRASASTSREGFMIGVAFTLGMAVVFFVLGLFISQIGVFFRDSKLFDLLAGVIMVLLGISSFKPLGEIIEPVMDRIRLHRAAMDGLDEPSESSGLNGPMEEKKSLLQKAVEFSLKLFRYSAFIGAFTLGIFFALGWAPCALSMVMPVLIWLASQDVAPLVGGTMLFFFGIGHGVPIIPITTFSRMVGGRIGEKYVSVGEWTSKIFGLLVILVGLVYAVRYFGYLLW
ncbi:cytochrome c biogenesis CcdA family protein [Methanothrix soehngenii]|uniref:cytochrome c biogenesis CcdA family protein n=1 Tax=Methanothrix TaxID=2222 RepID=UPI002A3594E7|nr:cytochrome c biogenesis CcdA family protein [Methanothrix soehngenii]